MTNTASKRVEVLPVFSHVCNEITTLAEAFSTKSAFMRFFARVNISMFLHVGFLMKAFSAVGASVRPGVTVN